MSHPRWTAISTTFPDGSPVYVCKSCGRVSPTPDPTCPKPAEVSYDGMMIYIPCEKWPVTPEEFYGAIEKAGQDRKCVFTGTVSLQDGIKVNVTAPITEKLARELVAVDAEIKLGEKARKEASEKAREDMMQSPIGVLGGSANYQARFQQHYQNYLQQAHQMGGQMARELAREESKLRQAQFSRQYLGQPFYGEDIRKGVVTEALKSVDNWVAPAPPQFSEEETEALKKIAGAIDEPKAEQGALANYYQKIIGGKK